MNIKILICAIVLLVVFLSLVFCRRRKNESEKIDPQTAKSRLRIMIAACNEIWMFLYQRPRPGLDKMSAVEVQNIFDGILLSLTREEAMQLYVSVKQKPIQKEDELQNSACSLIIRELSRRFGC